MKKPSRSALRNKLDAAFSRLIRSRGKCERCGMTEYAKLQTSHIYSRKNLSVRWDELNANCLCAGCHFWWHQNPTEGTDWLRTIYTKAQMDELRRRAVAIKKWSIPELQALLAEILAKT